VYEIRLVGGVRYLGDRSKSCQFGSRANCSNFSKLSSTAKSYSKSGRKLTFENLYLAFVSEGASSCDAMCVYLYVCVGMGGRVRGCVRTRAIGRRREVVRREGGVCVCLCVCSSSCEHHVELRPFLLRMCVCM